MNTSDTLLFATRNQHKAREFQSLLGDFINPSWRVFDIADWHDQVPEVVEDKETFWGNAVKKALEVSKHTGSVALSDDSGLEVDALDGAPGVYSARYAGPNATDEQNNRVLIKELEGVPEKKRTARYVCVAALAIPDNKIGRALIARTKVPFAEIGEAEPDKEQSMARVDNRIVVWFRGTVEGLIIDEPRGTEGFGYDPHFYVPQWDKTMAEVPLDKKNSISHRAEALKKMATFFQGRP
ncbi:non-canonical purine NTP pyrophosphatase [Persicimonas caeni]|uniref:dITP/XTP pyrophosphatase n=1 Tax=Persicimonas caeni TaxID=2292766 RepID=A0A4Y6PSY5_PERCE|nr:non-canonical purine NTP pyrophosphatase [Persicimonas caeni]QDG51436.1 non-canonical purine NTP pyrophosphatase [Persicimonas caeni]QED32657.1 non-canonical purine NTP pyrophosphatase [Persicimonas caeni]